MNSRIFYAFFVLISLGLVLGFFWQEDHRIEQNLKVFIVKNQALSYYEKEDIRKLYKKVRETKNTPQSLEKLETLPYVKSASFMRSLSGTHQMELTLQEPVFAMISGDVYKLVNRFGEVFSEVPQYKIPDLPILTGSNFRVRKTRRSAVEILKEIPDEGVISKKTLSEVLYTDDYSFVFSGVEGRVYIGKEDIAKRIKRLEKVVKYLRFHGLATERIDARYGKKVLVTLKEETS